jgi:hypothetical protein
MRRLTVALSITVLTATAGAASAEVNVDIHIGRPAPPPVVIAPAPAVVVVPPPVIAARPRVVAVPGTRVYHVPSVGFNVFVFGGKYYSHHHDRWFVATGHNAHWVAISEHRVPPPVLAVPVSYYKIPPGHAKKWRDDDRHGRRHSGRRGSND